MAGKEKNSPVRCPARRFLCPLIAPVLLCLFLLPAYAADPARPCTKVLTGDEAAAAGKLKVQVVEEPATRPGPPRSGIGQPGAGGGKLRLGPIRDGVRGDSQNKLRAEFKPSVQSRSARHGRTEAGDFSVGIYSHYAGFVTNYPHNDGPSYNYYNSTNEKMPVWGMASGGPAPGVENGVWVGGDFDQKYTTAPCGTPSDCYVPPPVDGLYRGWRTQGYSYGPCNCPTALQAAYFSANRGILMFDLSAIPDKATISRVGFEGKVLKQFGSGERLNMSQIDCDRYAGYENVAGSGFKWAYDDASDGHLYLLSWNVAPYAIGNPAATNLNSTALTDVGASLQKNWFGLGMVSGAGETSSTSYYFGAFEGSGNATPPMLTLDYHYVIPEAPTGPASAERRRQAQKAQAAVPHVVGAIHELPSWSQTARAGLGPAKKRRVTGLPLLS